MSDAVTQKEFYEVIQELRNEIHQVTVAMTKTNTLIRDYNGLREKINLHDDRIQVIEDHKSNKKEYREYLGWLVGFIGALLAILAYIQ